MTTQKIFSNLKVLDISTVLAGPSVGTFFAELGAHVTKIERPSSPDVTRAWKLPAESEEQVSAYFASVNYGKKKDYLAFIHLVKDCDILLMNFKGGDQEKLRITDDLLGKANPKLILGKISGFGEESDRVAYDLILQAEAGFMSMNGHKDGTPLKMPIALIDVLAAHHLKEGLLIALMERTKTNLGSSVEVSLYDAALCSLANQASNYLMTGKIPQRMGSLHPNIAPYGEIFSTSDGVQLTIAVGSENHFTKLLQLLNLNDLSSNPLFKDNQKRVKNRAELETILNKVIAQLSSDFLLAELRKSKIPYGEIKSLDKVFIDDRAKSLIREEKQSKTLTKRMTSIAFKWKKL
jgi:crotonobetainyl-CoA:carnitine CoA-transferase CaiB-like acyl-CoA transferase